MVLTRRRGQIFCFDTLFAFLIFCLIFVIIFSAAAQLAHSAADGYRRFELQKRLYDASEALVTTPGYPRDWTADDVVRLGLADYSENRVRHHELSLEKIGAMASLPEDRIAALLALDGLNVSVKITTRDGDLLLDAGGHGGAGNAIRRFALCGGEECVVEVSA